MRNDNLKTIHLERFLRRYWFAPQDVLLRSVEANIMHTYKFKHPILDIGTGDGSISKLLFPKTLTIDVGIDIDEQSLKKAKESGMYKRAMLANAAKMPFRNSLFNCVVSNSTFEHIEQDKQAVSEVARVLKENGQFFITVPSVYLQDLISSIEGWRSKKMARNLLKKFDRRVNHLHYRSVEEWNNIFKKNNLKLIFYTYYFPKATTYVWYKLFKFSVTKFRNREVWSYLAHSPLRKVIPEGLVIFFLKKFLFKKAYRMGLSTDSIGSMLFMIAKKES